MNALSPMSLFDKVTPAAVLGRVAGSIADQGRGKSGLAGAFSNAWMGLDANRDGTLNGKDVLAHAVNVRDSVLQGIADSFGYETGSAARAAREVAISAAQSAPDAARLADVLRPRGQAHRAAAAPPALPSAPAAKAVENLPGIDQIRATYAILRDRI